MDVIPGCKPCLEPAFEARHRFEAEGGGQRAGFEALPVVLADDQDLPVGRKLCRPRAQRLTRQAQGVRDVAAGEIEWRAHIHDLNVAVGLVVGETAVIGDDVSILHEVTLGGTGKERGDRHPKVRDVLLCAGAKVLGNVEIGRDAKVGAGSIVLQDVPPRATVAGVPARIVGWSSGSVPALEMDQSLPDYEI